MLAGEAGEARRVAMEILVGVSAALEAPALLEIAGAHVDSCLYHGPAGLDFATLLVEGGGRVAVPTTLNVGSLDLLHPHLFRGPPELAEGGRRLMEAYLALGCLPTWTCAPYQLRPRPRFGDQVAWGESNAIVFANSVLGARTERYGDFLDICCALTGRAPRIGLHTDQGRRAGVWFRVELPDRALDRDLSYALIGHVLGARAGTRVAALVGLDQRADEDRLKALGAAAASSGAVAMFHAVGVTPEAPSLEAAFGSPPPVPGEPIGEEDVERARLALSRGDGPLGAVSVGTPHFSAAQMTRLASLVAGEGTRVPFYVNTSRHVLAVIGDEVLAQIEAFGAVVVTDTCTYITPVMGEVEGVVLTDSAKWAYYAPANLGVDTRLASLEDCVASAAAGRVLVGGRW